MHFMLEKIPNSSNGNSPYMESSFFMHFPILMSLNFLNVSKNIPISFIGKKSMCGTYSRYCPTIDLAHHKEIQQHLNIKGI